MSVEIAPIEVVGLKDALKELNDIDKKLRRQITRDFKQIMAPVVADAQARLPQNAPLSGMARSWKPKGAEIMHWETDKVNRNLKAFTSGKKIREAPGGFKQNVGVFGLRWNGPQATFFEMARRGSISEQLSNRFGAPARLVWKAYEARRTDVEFEVRKLVNEVMRLTGRGGRI
jgi:hypothetical protein